MHMSHTGTNIRYRLWSNTRTDGRFFELLRLKLHSINQLPSGFWEGKVRSAHVRKMEFSSCGKYLGVMEETPMGTDWGIRISACDSDGNDLLIPDNNQHDAESFEFIGEDKILLLYHNRFSVCELISPDQEVLPAILREGVLGRTSTKDTRIVTTTSSQDHVAICSVDKNLRYHVIQIIGIEENFLREYSEDARFYDDENNLEFCTTSNNLKLPIVGDDYEEPCISFSP